MEFIMRFTSAAYYTNVTVNVKKLSVTLTESPFIYINISLVLFPPIPLLIILPHLCLGHIGIMLILSDSIHHCLEIR